MNLSNIKENNQKSNQSYSNDQDNNANNVKSNRARRNNRTRYMDCGLSSQSDYSKDLELLIGSLHLLDVVIGKTRHKQRGRRVLAEQLIED